MSQSIRCVLACVLGGLLLGYGVAYAAEPGISQTPAEPPPLEPTAGLGELVAWAEASNPALVAAEHRYRAAVESVPQAKAMPDPRLRVGWFAVPIETRVGPQHGQIELSQELPGRGKRPTRESTARAEAEAAYRAWQRMRWDLAFQIADAYYDLYFLQRSIEITRDNRDLLIYLEQTIRKAYEAGNAPYADLVRGQVEIGKLENDLESLIDSRSALEERLNRLLHRPGTSALPTPRVIVGPQALQSEEVLRERLSDAAPDRNVLEAELQVAEQRVRLADVEDRPDWRVGLAYFPTGSAINPSVPGSGDDPVLASVSFKLPIGRKKYVAAERAAAERRSATLAELDSTDDRLQSALAAALYRFRNADREIGLYRETLLPKAEQSFEASEAGFRTGAVTVRDLVDAQQILLQFELSYERALSERGRAVASLERLVGGSVEVSTPGGSP